MTKPTGGSPIVKSILPPLALHHQQPLCLCGFIGEELRTVAIESACISMSALHVVSDGNSAFGNAFQRAQCSATNKVHCISILSALSTTQCNTRVQCIATWGRNGFSHVVGAARAAAAPPINYELTTGGRTTMSSLD